MKTYKVIAKEIDDDYKKTVDATYTIAEGVNLGEAEIVMANQWIKYALRIITDYGTPALSKSNIEFIEKNYDNAMLINEFFEENHHELFESEFRIEPRYQVFIEREDRDGIDLAKIEKETMEKAEEIRKAHLEMFDDEHDYWAKDE